MNERKANRLINETSPYLLQHAYNPVDWYPWGPEALERARRENRPIFLSIGYSACHWCHVMEHESFEDPATAALMNEHFINIKVDREERPDLDQIYMNAVQLMTQHGGWPMSVWLTPDLKPFYGGTYFPPQPRYNMPSFRGILERVAETWKEKEKEVIQSADQILEYLHRMGSIEPQEEAEANLRLIAAAGNAIEQVFDPRYGGIGNAPKFPHSVEMRVALRASRLTGRDTLEHVATYSLEKMIRGGIYDQLGGGFHRYSTDAKWLVPHFEKMLYDNALIPLACLEAYQVTGAEIYRRATVETLDYVLREMTAENGAFYSTQDADSEGVEGKFFVWDHAEVMALLGPVRGKLFCHCYDVTPEGNWEGKNILHLPLRFDECADELEVDVDTLMRTLRECRQVLFEARSKRVWPGRDDKILTSWNAMMIDAFASAAPILEEPRYTEAAVRAAQFLWENMRRDDGLMYRTAKDGKAHLNAYLEDYAYFANALVSLYEATFDPTWITRAIELVDIMKEQFWDAEQGGFFYTGNDHEQLITRGKDPHDSAIPNGNAMAVTALARLYKLTGKPQFQELADRTLELFASVLNRSPIASSQMLIALGLHQGQTVEIALVGEPEDPAMQQLLRVVHSRYLPNKVLALRRPKDTQVETLIPLLQGKEMQDGRPMAYVCRNFTCQEPVTEPEKLREQLELATQQF